ncbi:unnamed protein product, partial [marine sediment metagenome]
MIPQQIGHREARAFTRIDTNIASGWLDSKQQASIAASFQQAIALAEHPSLSAGERAAVKQKYILWQQQFQKSRMAAGTVYRPDDPRRTLMNDPQQLETLWGGPEYAYQPDWSELFGELERRQRSFASLHARALPAAEIEIDGKAADWQTVGLHIKDDVGDIEY